MAWAHVDGPSEQMHGQQRLSRRRDRCFDLIEIDQIGGSIDIHKHRCGTNGADGCSGGEKTEGTGDHLITSANAEGPQGKNQGVGAAVAAHGMAAAADYGEGLLELFDLRSTDVLATAQHVQHRLFEVLAQITDLLAEAEGRNPHKQNLKRICRTTPAPVRGSISRCSPPRRSGRG